VALRHYYDLESEKDTRPTIVVVGERTPLYKGWSSKDRSLYAHVFEFVREKFSKHRLLFRPRERLTNLESVKPFITGFEVMPADIPFEELCIRNSYSKVISIKSTACKVAAYCGDPAYVLFPLFDFPPAYRRIIEAYLSDAQDIVRVRDLRELLHDPQTRRRLDIDEMKHLYWQALMETTQ